MKHFLHLALSTFDFIHFWVPRSWLTDWRLTTKLYSELWFFSDNKTTVSSGFSVTTKLYSELWFFSDNKTLQWALVFQWQQNYSELWFFSDNKTLQWALVFQWQQNSTVSSGFSVTTKLYSELWFLSRSFHPLNAWLGGFSWWTKWGTGWRTLTASPTASNRSSPSPCSPPLLRRQRNSTFTCGKALASSPPSLC